MNSVSPLLPPGLVVFSGGTGGNAMVSAIQAISNRVTYVLPISDNGGSTSEILRVLGGIGVGDLRSRLIRLIPDAEEGTDLFIIKTLLSHRLPPDRALARAEWLDIVEGISPLWQGMSNEKNQAIRSFLRVVNSELVKRARSTNSFDYSTGAVGNLFLTGMRLFFGSIETAIFLFSSITGIDNSTQVLPILSTSYMSPIAALLSDGSIIAGQNVISHPSAFSAVSATGDTSSHEDANLPGSLASLRSAGIHFDKTSEEPLSSPIDEIYYINPYGQRMTLAANPRVLAGLREADAILFSPGSLYTSLVPLIIAYGVGQSIIESRRSKIFFLNGSLDRETPGYTAMDFLGALAKAAGSERIADICTHLIYLRGRGTPIVQEEALRQMGIKTICIAGQETVTGMQYLPENVNQLLSALLTKNIPVRRSTINHHTSQIKTRVGSQ